MTKLTGSLGVRNEINVDIIGTGARGKEGKSAYEIWLDLGNEGTEQEYLASLKGDTGPRGEQGIQGETGKSIEYTWNGTQLGVRIEGETNYTYVNLKGDKGDIGNTGKSLEFTWNGTQLGIRQEGDATFQYINLKGDKGDTGNTGKGLEFNWNGTQLGVRVEGDATYQYVNLKGDKGDTGAKGDKGDPGEVTAAELAAVTSQLADIAHSVGILSGDVSSWGAVQQLVQDGFGQAAFPVGTQLRTNHTVHGEIIWDVVAHDHLKSVRDQNAHTMTLLQHDLLPALQFDAPEAFYYAETELLAGTYNFTLAETYSSWLAGTYEFTLTQAVPAGGQLDISGYADADMTAQQVRSFASRTTTTVTESVAIISGNGGTSLGTFGEQLNHTHRVSNGSNNYKESAMRQFLNSSAAGGSVWTPQTKFDRPPSWLTTTAGFVAGLSQEFLAVVGDVVLPCSANNTYEAPDSTVVKNTKYTLNDKFYLLSQREVFGVNSNIVADDSVLLPFYDGATAADRIKYQDGVAATWWVRTPNAGNATIARRVNSDGTMSNVLSSFTFSAPAPACTIV